MVTKALLLFTGLAAFACGAPPEKPARPAPPPPATKESLYARLGGKPAVEAVVRDFVARLGADDRIRFRFANSDIPQLTADLVDFVCAAAGGPCKYRGREMQVLHASMQITEEEWEAAVEGLVAVLDAHQIGLAEKHEVLGAIGATKQDIVDPPAKKPPPEELAKIDAAGRDMTRFGKRADFMKAAFDALRRGQRSYADQLFSMVENWLGPEKVSDVAPLFREGAPPRVTARVSELPADTPPQPKGAVGGSEQDEPERRPEKGSLAGQLRFDGGGDSFGVVMLTPLEGRGRRRIPKHRVIEQRGREFAPRLMAVPVGSTVAFPNFDPIYHNVFSRSDTRPFDLGIFKNGQSREVKFDRPGIVKVGCNLHANMSTTIIIVGAPHYAVTDKAGRFRFRSLRPGPYMMRAWTERSAEPFSKRIEVTAGENELALDAPGGAAAGPGPDKFGAPRGKAN